MLDTAIMLNIVTLHVMQNGKTLFIYMYSGTCEYKGHFGTNHFVPCREAVLFSEVENVLHIHFWGYWKCPLYREVVPFSEGPLLTEV